MNVKQVSWGYNANLGRFTNFVNLMDMAGIAIPSGLLQCEIIHARPHTLHGVLAAAAS